MPRPHLALFILAVVATACTTADTTATTTSTSEPTTTTTSATSAADHRLAIATVGGDIVVYDGAGTERATLDPGQGSAYRQPVWTSDGGLVASFASVDADTGLAALDPVTGDVRWEAAMSSPPFYYLPAPAGSPDSTTSLRNDPDGSGLVAEVVDRSGETRELARTSPFYATWSPDGGSLATHEGTARVLVRSGADSTVIAQPSGSFQAPVWVDDGLVTIRTVDGEQRLAIWDGDDFRDLLVIDGPVRFAAAGASIAIQAIDADAGDGVQASVRAQSSVPDLPGGRLVVVAIDTGDITSITEVLTPMFQWDPDGDRLLFAEFESADELDFRWSVWEDGTVSDGPSWRAQPIWFRDVVPFFDQYVQSMSLWSPDGSAYAYPEIVDARPRVTIQPVDGTPAVSLEDAVWVSWRTAAP